MGSKPNIVLTADRPFIEQVRGPDKGRVIELDGERMTIGRTDENDIVVASEAVSRTHAFLMRSEGAWFIRDNNSKNGILVNGEKVSEAWLQNGDVVQVGNFVFRFREPSAEGGGAATVDLANTNAVPGSSGTDFAAPKKKPNRRILIYGVLALVLALVYVSQNQEGGNETEKKPTTREEAVQILKEDLAKVDAQIAQLSQASGGQPEEEELAPLMEKKKAIEREMAKRVREFEVAKEPDLAQEQRAFTEAGRPKGIQALEDPTLKQAEQEMAKLDWSNSSLREAEQFFRKGQREFLAGNFQRAIDSFQTALSFYRGHKLAEKYLRLAIFEVETAARNHLATGVQYFESLQYQRAIYHFGEVINLMQHRPQESIVGEAERYIALSKKRLQAAELFP